MATLQRRRLLLAQAAIPPNLLRWSEAFDNAAWVKTEATIVANSVVAPDGQTTAETLLETVVASAHNASQSYTLAVNDVVTWSAYVKGGLTRNFAVLGVIDGTQMRAWVNLTTGAITNVAAGITAPATAIDAGGGWWRVQLTRTITTAGARPFSVGAADAAGNGGYAGNAALGIYVWGGQLVKGAVPGPYQPTQ